MNEPTLSSKDDLERPYSNSNLGEWYDLFSDTDIVLLNSILRKVELERKDKTIYPNQEDLLRIYESLAPKDVKVVILGQDPYHNGNANGFAFGCAIEESPSLGQLKEGLKSCGYIVGEMFDDTLSDWVEEGVFLLNTKLSVVKGSPNSHSYLGWDKFIEATLKVLAEINPNVVYVLLGNNAAEFSSLIGEGGNVLKETHPANASYSNTKWKTRIFLEVNEVLDELNITPVNWAL